MERKSTFGAALRDIRIHKGIAQEQLGSQSFVSTIERGIRSPTVERMEEMAHVLRVSPVTLVALAQAKAGEGIEEVFARAMAEAQELLQ